MKLLLLLTESPLTGYTPAIVTAREIRDGRFFLLIREAGKFFRL
jgi:hypothetical protein